MPTTNNQWKKQLTPNQYHICREGGTEPPFSGTYVHQDERGMYRCVACGAPLFSSDTKFDSGTGWPSFWNSVNKDAVKLQEDTSLGMHRTEVRCATCGSHLGHVFDDGPKEKTGLRYCINSVALDFKKKQDVYRFPRRVLCVFAHPDDEAFGPGGTIALWTSQGAEVHLLCATRGENGLSSDEADNSPNPTDTTRIRTQELKKSAKILGIKTVEFLDFPDGHIGNNDLSKLEAAIVGRIRSLRPDILLTFNLNGVSGHLDHIVVASATTQAFRKTKIAKKLYYSTVPDIISRLNADYFIFFPEGPDPDEMDEIINVSSVWDIRMQAMDQHQSQAKDIADVKRDKACPRRPSVMMFVYETEQSSAHRFGGGCTRNRDGPCSSGGRAVAG